VMLEHMNAGVEVAEVLILDTPSTVT